MTSLKSLYSISKIRPALLAILVLALFAMKGFAKLQVAHAHKPSKNGFRFLLKNENGKIINVAKQKGKVVFLNFWALSCVPCKEEMPTINQLSSHFKADTNILILPVDLDNDLANSPGYIKEKGFGLTVYYAASQVPEAFFHGQLPTTVVIDKNGKIALFHEGQDDYSTKKFIAYIDELRKK